MSMSQPGSHLAHVDKKTAGYAVKVPLDMGIAAQLGLAQALARRDGQPLTPWQHVASCLADVQEHAASEAVYRVVARDRRLRDKATPEVVAEAAQAQFNWAKALCELGHFDQAQDVLQALIDAQFDRGDPNLFESMAQLGVVHLRLHQAPRARELLSKTHETLCMVFGPTAGITLRVANTLAAAKLACGESHAAITLYEFIVKHAAALGDELDLVLVRENLAVALYEVGHYEPAASHFEWAMQQCLQRGDGAGQARNRAQRAMAHFRLGHHALAAVTLRRTLQQQRSLLGDTHKDTLATLGSLAVVLEEMGQWDEAETHYRNALAARLEIEPSDTGEVITAMNNLAAFLMARGRCVEAQAQLKSALMRCRRALPAGHLLTAVIVTRLGHCMLRLSCDDEALTYLEEGFESLRTMLGEDHPRTAWARDGLAQVRQHLSHIADQRLVLR